MRFRYRLGYYMAGFSIGLFLVAAIWSGKDARCNYFPNARVLNDLRTKSFIYSETATAKIAQDWVDTVDVVNTLKYGDVDFDQSNVPTEGGKLYVVEGKTTKNLPITLQVINYENKAVLKDILK
jgi:hypothetical protein